MGFFSKLFGKKPSCPQCGQKLHPSWPQCPFCGWSAQAPRPQAPPPQPIQQPQKTLFLDANVANLNLPTSNNLVGWLIQMDGPAAGNLFEIRGRSILGKSPDCNIVVVEPSISSHHVEFIPTPGGYRMNDLGSTNGTYVNDRRVTTYDLVDNDNIRFGRANFKYKSTI